MTTAPYVTDELNDARALVKTVWLAMQDTGWLGESEIVDLANVLDRAHRQLEGVAEALFNCEIQIGEDG